MGLLRAGEKELCFMRLKFAEEDSTGDILPTTVSWKPRITALGSKLDRVKPFSMLNESCANLLSRFLSRPGG